MFPIVSASWRNVLFVHWPVAPAAVRPHLPDGLRLDTVDGEAYLAVVALVMADTGPVGVPFGRTIAECNVRTYVTDGDRPAVYFVSLDVDDVFASALAGSLLGLPCHRADVGVSGSALDRDGVLRVRCRRRSPSRDDRVARFDGRFERRGSFERPAIEAIPGALVERYRFYVSGRGDRLLSGDIEHDPWRIAPADGRIATNTLIQASSLEEPSAEPLVHVGNQMDVTVGPLRVVR